MQIDKKTGMFTVNCRSCGQNYQDVSEMKCMRAAHATGQFTGRC